MNLIRSACCLSFLIACLLPAAKGQPVYSRMPGEASAQYMLVPDLRDTGALMQQILRGHALSRTRPDSAIVLLRDGLRRSRRDGFARGIVSALICLGNAYVNKGMYHAALPFLREGLSLAAVSEQAVHQLPVLYNNIANICRFTGHYEQALAYYYRAILMSRYYPGSISLSQLYGNLASLLQLTGQQERGFYYLRLAEKGALAEGDSRMLGGILINEGVYFAHKKEWATSRLYFLRARDIGTRAGSYSLRYNALNNLGALYLLQQQPQQALPCLLEAEAFGDSVNTYYRNGVRIALGETYLALGKYDRAATALHRAKAVAEKARLAGDLQEIYDLLARLSAATGKYRQAYDYHIHAAALKDSLSGLAVAERVNGLEVRYRTAEKGRAILRYRLQIKQQEEKLREKNLWIAGAVAGSLVLSVFFAGLYRLYRHKQRLHAHRYRLLQREQEIGQLKAVMKGEEQERARIAQDLHDGIGGMLASIKMHLGAVKKQTPDPGTIHGLEEVMRMLGETATEIRKTSHNLMPDVLLRYDLPEALRIYCEQIHLHDHLQADLQFYGDLASLDQSLALTLYRIVQELIQNILKHAQATQAAIQVREHAGIITITVEDNGIGFAGDPEAGMGVRQIRSRVQLLQGYFALESVPGKGTTAYIELEIPNLAKG